MKPTDEDIMQAVARGDLDRLAELYRRYRDPLFGFLVNRMRGDRDTAEDLLHTTFERVIKYRASYRDKQNFQAWIFTVARNVFRDHCRISGRMPTAEGTEMHDLSLTTDSALTAWIGREEKQQCNAALAALPDNYRAVVELAWKRNMKYADIATVLGTTEANVKVRMHRACKQLKVNYQKINR